ncbi:MAG: hypothetical protein HY587_07730 [Candidatus Omnitrophica bacterium]|nr:hypothetical protein [Candidatus Omnitrophota bacterium]
MPESILVFRKQTAELKGTDADLALSCAAEYLDEPLHAHPVATFSSGCCLSVSRTKGILLVYFFKNPSLFLGKLGSMLNDYAKTLKLRHEILAKYPYLSASTLEEKINVYVFVPSFEEDWSEVAALIRIPLEIIPFSIVTSRNQQAIVLENGRTIPHGQLPPLAHSFEAAKAAAVLSQQEEWEREIVQPKQPSTALESYFQRAKLNSEEIKSLLDFELQLENIKSSTSQISV